MMAGRLSRAAGIMGAGRRLSRAKQLVYLVA
jgi:hypothetical protein